jgi:condensin complex subunit 2
MAATDYPSESPAVTYESDGEVDDYCQYEAYDNYDAGDDGDVDARSVHGDGDGDESESPQAAVAHQSKIQWNAVFSGSESSPSSTLRSSGGGSDQLDALWEGGTAADEYAYFDFSVLNKTNAWAGARHWKLAMRTRSQARDVSKIEDAADTADGGPGVGEDVAGEEEAVVEGAKKKGKKSTTKEKFLIDFFGPEIDAAQLAAPSSSAKADSTQLTATALQKAFSAAKQGINDLPPDAKLQARDLCRLFLSPKIVVPPPKLQYAVASAPAPASSSSSLSAALGQGDEDRIWGEVGTGGGSAPIADCPDGAACDDVVDYVYEDDGDDGDDGYFGGYDDMQGGDENAPSADPVESVRQKMQKGLHIDMDKMVKAGRTVQKIHIGYAKKTTRVNVRKLKTDIWGHIDRTTTDSSLSNSDENIISGVEDEESAVVEKSVAKRGDLEGPLSFQELIADVGAEQQQENVSLPFYFICLLHLANEKVIIGYTLPSMCM